jgi:hypothetical protein
MDLQEELKRVGCYSGSPEGAWDEATRAALEDFASQAKVTLSTEAPTEAALNVLRASKAGACAPGPSAERKVDAKEETTNAERPARGERPLRSATAGGRKAKGRICTPINGPHGYYDDPWCQ